MTRRNPLQLNRRDLLKLGSGALAGSAAALRPRPALGQHGNWPILDNANYACAGQGYTEVFPTSPFILNPFTDPLPVPAPLKPTPLSEVATWATPPDPRIHDSDGGLHQIRPAQLGLPDPIYYRIKLQVAQHNFTTSFVQPIDTRGLPVVPPGSTHANPRKLPGSTIYGFNGTFPGPMIYARYGQPCVVRFENELDQNPLNLDRNDFGDPAGAFLTHLHNAHNPPESDGNPNYRPTAYHPGQWCDNLYLNYPAGGDDNEKQSFLWFHDHRMHMTGANVYQGMVGLYPIYDPKLDPGDERITTGLRLPGVPNPTTGRVDYDIPLALYDCSFDDGVVEHKDFHNGCGESHPEWWGQTFFRHFPNHGFVGDVFTVNCVAYPVLEVKRRKYRLRLLGASIARCYNIKFMSSTCGPVPAPGKQGQWSLPDGQQSMNFTQIATDGGLMPYPLVRNEVEIWPGKRREIVIDFTRYMDGSPTTKGDVIYMVNTLQMTNGRKPNDGTDRLEDGTIVIDPEYDPNYCVPLMKIVIGDDTPDVSQVPKTLRPLTPIDPRVLAEAPRREFLLERSGKWGGEDEWLINGYPFDPTSQMAITTKGVPEVWTIVNGSGGWVHPMHFHQEEHRTLERNGVKTPFDRRHPDDESREDVIALDPNETVVIYRNFRTFTGPFVAHCHNLAHEDHSMMFGFEIAE
jgi:FtsP/CotA-like multicopper oxidase with cupredoxin domain